MGATADYWEIERYLKDPEREKERFWMGPAVFWFDWREYDEDIVRCISESLPEERDRFDFELRDSPLPRGLDILLKRGGQTAAIPYAPEQMDRDTTLRAVQAFIAPGYQLRCFVPSMKSDTLGFCLLSSEEWGRLEAEFGARIVARQFRHIGPDSRMFG